MKASLLLSSLLPFAILSACGSQPVASTTAQAGTTADITGADDFLNPADARVSVSGNIAVQAVSDSIPLKVPSISFQLTKADYVQVLRCSSSYVVKTPQGVDFKTVSADDPQRSEDFRFAWAEAFGSPLSCTLVGNQIAGSSLQDLAAKDGTFYYLFNPCIFPEHSKIPGAQGDALCSYELQQSSPLIQPYHSTLTQAFTDAAVALSIEQGHFSAIFSQLHSASEKLKVQVEDCEAKAALAAAMRANFAGIVGLISMGVSAATGFVITGPVSQILGVNNLVGAAEKFILGGDGQNVSVIEQCRTDAGVLDTIQQMKDLTASVDGEVKKIVTIRNQLAQINAQYTALDSSLLSHNVSGQ